VSFFSSKGEVFLVSYLWPPHPLGNCIGFKPGGWLLARGSCGRRWVIAFLYLAQCHHVGRVEMRFQTFSEPSDRSENDY